MRYQFEAVARLPEHEHEHEQGMVRDLIDAAIVKNQVAGALERVTSASQAAAAPAKKATPAKKGLSQALSARQRLAMSTSMEHAMLPLEAITHRIVVVRGQKVLLDSDLAALYGVKPSASLKP